MHPLHRITIRFRGKRHILEERLKLLMQELGNAINETLSDSDRIAEAIGEIKRAGYDVFLVLETTIRRAPRSPVKTKPLRRAYLRPPARSSSRLRTTNSCAP